MVCLKHYGKYNPKSLLLEHFETKIQTLLKTDFICTVLQTELIKLTLIK